MLGFEPAICPLGRFIRVLLRKSIGTKVLQKSKAPTKDYHPIRVENSNRYPIDLASDKGSANHGVKLQPEKIRTSLRHWTSYGWEPKHLQVICPGGINFPISHGLHCTKVAYTQMRLNANKSTSAKQLRSEAAMMYLNIYTSVLDCIEFRKKTPNGERTSTSELRSQSWISVS